MKKLLLFVIGFSLLYHAEAASWTDNFTELDHKRWSVVGNWVERKGGGLTLGNEDTDWATSGIRTTKSVGKPTKSVKLTAVFSNFKVTKVAKRQRDLIPCDNGVGLTLTPDPERRYFDTSSPGVQLTLLYDGALDSLQAVVFAKGANRPNGTSGALASSMLRKGMGDAKVRAVLEVNGWALHVHVFLDDQNAWSWNGCLPEELGSVAYPSVFYQNTINGRGSADLESVTVDVEELSGAD